MYDCSYCETNPYYFDVLGHDGPPAGMWTENLVNDEPLALCPQRQLLLASREVLREVSVYETEIYPLYKKGFLLHAGSIGDQPARELALFREFDQVTERARVKVEQVMRDNPEGGEV